MIRTLNVCVVGAGAVGVELLRVLKQRRFPIRQLTVLARSARPLQVDGTLYDVHVVTPEAFERQDLILFAGTEGEKGACLTHAKEAIRRGAVCIDNGSDFRLDPKVPLVIPEINPEDIRKHDGLLANPNCSTIQMAMALHPLRKAAPIRRVIVSTYQAASGAGRSAVEELKAQSEALLRGVAPPTAEAIPKVIGFNAVAQIGPFQEAGYTSEEWKMVHETRKIFHDPTLRITATAVRIPVMNAHAESVYVEMEKPVPVAEAVRLWKDQPGLTVLEAPEAYPTTQDADGKDNVLIGRIRPDPNEPRALVFWVVCDNLRKGAALNAIQIAEQLLR